MEGLSLETLMPVISFLTLILAVAFAFVGIVGILKRAWSQVFGALFMMVFVSLAPAVLTFAVEDLGAFEGSKLMEPANEEPEIAEWETHFETASNSDE